MSPAMTFGMAQARLLCLLDDAARRACADTAVGVILSGKAQDAAILGFVSLYRTDPVRSYAATNNALAHAAAVRFGALHQTCPIQGTDPNTQLATFAAKDGLTPISGAVAGPGPFADPAMKAFFAALPADMDQAQLISTALTPLLGQTLAHVVGETHSDV
jgi:hypothetical protein